MSEHYGSAVAQSVFAVMSAMSEHVRKDDLTDWLDLHGITEDDCRGILNNSRMPCGGDRNGNLPHKVSGDVAWRMSAEAMTRMFPARSRVIEEVMNDTVRNFDSEVARPMTLPTYPSGAPFVLMKYAGRKRDLLTVAHEFGHALQLTICHGDFVPPAIREICAFLSEIALLEFLKDSDPELHHQIASAWTAENRYYATRCGAALDEALDDRHSQYCYSWNYALARPLATQIFETVPCGTLFDIYEDRIPLSGLVRFLGCGMRNSASCDAACLTFMSVTEPEAGIPLI